MVVLVAAGQEKIESSFVKLDNMLRAVGHRCGRAQSGCSMATCPVPAASWSPRPSWAKSYLSSRILRWPSKRLSASRNRGRIDKQNARPHFSMPKLISIPIVQPSMRGFPAGTPNLIPSSMQMQRAPSTTQGKGQQLRGWLWCGAWRCS